MFKRYFFNKIGPLNVLYGPNKYKKILNIHLLHNINIS